MRACCAAAVVGALWLLLGPALAESSRAAQRASLSAEREAIEVEHGRAVADCQTRFVVSSCVEETDGRRRRALADLQTRERALDAAVRAERAAERERRLSAKAAASAPTAHPAASAPVARQAASAPVARQAASAAARDRSSGGGSAGGVAARPARAAPKPILPPPDEAAERTDWERRQREAQAQREAVERRNAQRAQKQPRAAPLPVPPAASVP